MPEPALIPEQYAAPDTRPLLRAALVLGIGLGATLDGLLFHEILGWHHLATERLDGTRANLLADGLFHAAAWLATLLGVVLLWRAVRAMGHPHGGRILAGGALLGGAAYNATDIVLNHFILRLHWLHASENPLWDVGFLALNALLMLLAWRLIRSDGTHRLQRAERKHRRALGQP